MASAHTTSLVELTTASNLLIKLSANNYHTWNTQITHILQAHDLYGKRYQPSHHASSNCTNSSSFGDNSQGSKQPNSSSSNWQYCDRKGHTAKTCYCLHDFPIDHPRHQANLAHHEDPSDISWLLDFGVSHHVTNDISHLSISNYYTGQDKLHIANGNGLSIQHHGSIEFNIIPLRLSNILHVPFVTQNLIYVSQLCQTNSESVEFSLGILR